MSGKEGMSLESNSENDFVEDLPIFYTVQIGPSDGSDVSGKTATIYYQACARAPDARTPSSDGTWTLIYSVTTSSDGNYSHDWNPADDMLNG